MNDKIISYRVYTRKLAALLRAEGFELLGIDKDYKHEGYDNYLFADSPELRAAIERLTHKV